LVDFTFHSSSASKASIHPSIHPSTQVFLSNTPQLSKNAFQHHPSRPRCCCFQRRRRPLRRGSRRGRLGHGRRPQWVIQGFTRTCNAADTSCTVSFAVNTQQSPATACSYTVTGSPASQASTNGITCGPYTISSGWSGQFGPGNGFTTWSVVDFSKRLIVWPAYNDRELVNGAAVTPDKSYAPQNLP